MKNFKKSIGEISWIKREYKEELIKIVSKYGTGDVTVNDKTRVEEILTEIFMKEYDKTCSIPLKFIKSGTGSTLIKILLESTPNSQLSFGASEMAVLLGKSRSSAMKYFQEEKIDGYKIGGKYYTTEDGAMKCLMSVGRKPMNHEEAKERIDLMKKLMSERRSMEEIKVAFKYEKSWMNE